MPHVLSMKEKEISFKTHQGNDCRKELFDLEFEKLKMNWSDLDILYRFYKVITLPFSLLVSSERYLNIRRYYNNNKLFKLRKKLFPN